MARTMAGELLPDELRAPGSAAAIGRAKEPDGGCGGGRRNTLLCMEPGGSTVDVFDGVKFTWTSVETGGDDKKKGKGGGGGSPRESLELELSFDAEHTDTALERYVPFVMSTALELQLRDRALRIFRTLARNYFLVDDHELFPEIQELPSAAEVTPAEESEMLLRCENVDVALRGLKELLKEKRMKIRKETEENKDVA